MYYTLTILDVTGIQDYIFSSNRLRENIGGSELVRRATEDWVYAALPEPHNVKENKLDDTRHIERDGLAAEVIYAAGGNSLIIFRDPTAATAFVTALSKKLIEEAPGLGLAVVHKTFDWDTEALGGKKDKKGGEGGVVEKAFKELAKLKRSQPGNHPLAGLGVTAACQSTGQVAIGTNEHLPGKGADDPIRLISAEAEAKLAVAPQANEYLKRKYFAHTTYDIPSRFDDLGGSKGDKSYIAVVHADGNNMGQRVEGISKKHSTPGTGNRDYIQAARAFSRAVKEAAEAAFLALRDHLLQAIDPVTDTIGDVVHLKDRKVPFRPLVMGGDDLTFVCDGRLALALTTFYLRAFEEKTAALGVIHACAGIAVVKSHYPFARAYDLAEELCKSAKGLAKKDKAGRERERDISALDWHFAMSGLMGDLDFIRKREYATKEGCLLARPLALAEGQNDWRDWPTFEKIVDKFKTGKEWAGRHNKVKGLREALRAGREAVKQFRTAYLPKPDGTSKLLPEIDAYRSGLQETGWDVERCGYFDAIEATDFYIDLAPHPNPLPGGEGTGSDRPVPSGAGGEGLSDKRSGA
jgi:hypothetical protein